jgi:glycerophosphoryl diester phosphodiesterase
MIIGKHNLIRAALGLALVVALLIAYVLFPWPVPPAASFTLVAHRGVHQAFPLTNLNNDTCTGKIIYPPTHDFIENTIPSMREAFANGATAIELDIHRTADEQLIVFHDWRLDCRTDGTGTTNEQPLAFLKTLDVGFGYTADGGQTFPLRGKGVGMMPTLPEVLAAFPNEQFVIHDKDGDAETRQLLIEFLGTLSAEQRSRLTYWGGEGFAPLHVQIPEVQPYFYGQDELQACLGDYLLRMLFTGSLPERCRQQIIGIPYRMLPSIPGWPNLILARAHQAGARVFITDVDTVEQLEAIANLPIDGIQTNHIEVIGPLVGRR